MLAIASILLFAVSLFSPIRELGIISCFWTKLNLDFTSIQFLFKNINFAVGNVLTIPLATPEIIAKASGLILPEVKLTFSAQLLLIRHPIPQIETQASFPQ